MSWRTPIYSGTPPMEVQKNFWNGFQKIRWGLISIPRVKKNTFCEPFSRKLKAQIMKIFIFSAYKSTQRADKKTLAVCLGCPYMSGETLMMDKIRYNHIDRYNSVGFWMSRMCSTIMLILQTPYWCLANRWRKYWTPDEFCSPSVRQ